jgi:AraC-like DNA-binding protein
MERGHKHDDYELYYLFTGQRKYFIKDRLYLIEKGSLVFIPKYDIHRTIDGEALSHERIVLNFKDSFLECFQGERFGQEILLPFHKEIHTLKLNVEDQCIVENLFHRMIKEVTEKPSGFELYLKSLMAELLLHIMRFIEAFKGEVIPFETPIQQKISEIATYINSNYWSSLTLTHLSERFSISTYYLSRVFKEISGYSFVEYLNLVRIKEAQRLLRDTDNKITSVSEQVGFDSTAHFGRVFKQIVELSPTRYRSRNEKKVR